MKNKTSINEQVPITLQRLTTNISWRQEPHNNSKEPINWKPLQIIYGTSTPKKQTMRGKSSNAFSRLRRHPICGGQNLIISKNRLNDKRFKVQIKLKINSYGHAVYFTELYRPMST
ncbi:hypothetical protein SFRURICE_006897 [Spodoptera frugiperda]|nr:hypothetical protein SFRURICE_006897 [Spodoptera frugiperda]